MVCRIRESILLWCHACRAGHERHPTGVSHFNGFASSSYLLQKERPPGGWFTGYGSRLYCGVMPVEPGMSDTPPGCRILMGSTPSSYLLQKERPPGGWSFFLEQDTGVEPAFTAWEAVVLPIYESCMWGYYSRLVVEIQPFFVGWFGMAR